MIYGQVTTNTETPLLTALLQTDTTSRSAGKRKHNSPSEDDAFIVDLGVKLTPPPKRPKNLLEMVCKPDEQNE